MKFIAIPDVESVLADDCAEEFLRDVRQMVEPADHGKKPDIQLLVELRKKFM